MILNLLPSLVSAVVGGMEPTGTSIQSVFDPSLPITMQATLQGEDGRTWTLDLYRHSVRADNYRVLEQQRDGSYVEIEPGPVNTYRGILAGQPQTRVVAAVVGDQLVGGFEDKDGRWWIEEDGLGGQVLKHESEVEPCKGTCGTDDLPIFSDEEFEEGFEDLPELPSGFLGGLLDECQLACDMDYEFYQDYGGNSESKVNSDINNVNGFNYEPEVNVTHTITTLIIRSDTNDPYSTNNAGDLLGQVRSHWIGEQQGVQRDLVQMFTGRNLAGSTIGVAYLDAICSTNIGYGLCETGFSTSCQTDLISHELGHNWGCQHIDDGNTMNSSLTCSNNFSASSRSTIETTAATSGCIGTAVPDAGACCFNSGFCTDLDESGCEGSGGFFFGLGEACPAEQGTCEIPEPEGSCCFPSGTCSVVEISDCADGGGEFRGVDSTCAGVDCLAGACCFGTDACTTTNEVQCNAAGGSFQNTGSACATVDCTPSTGACCIDGTCAQLEQAVCLSVSGTFGGAGVDCGSVVCEQPCPEDLDNNGSVDFNDILSLLAAWGPCGTCDEDIDENGTVDFADLLVVLAAYGDC